MMFRQFIKEKTLGVFVKTNGFISQYLFAGMGFILCLHRVLPKNMHCSFWGNSGMAVSPEYLQWLIDFIRKSEVEIISLDEALKRIKTGISPKKFAVITLDDGWRDNLQYGLPVFDKNRVPFTIYLATCFADGTARAWAEDLTKMVASKTSFEFSYSNTTYVFSLTHQHQKIEAYHRIRHFILEAQSKDEFEKRLQAVFGTVESISLSESLTWDEVKQLSTHPLCTIGAHTVNHLPLAKLSESEALNEMIISKKTIEKKLGTVVRHFAYPFGTANECSHREFRLAAEAGFETAVTGRQANLFHQHAEHLTAIPRYPIGESTQAERLNYIINGVLHFSFNGFKKVVTD
jgi:peptidoglycan/xylan/chitin deacetylase (PgdA/CDA1 family)